jgi:hypothetical protein
MTPEESNDIGAVKTKTIEFLTELMNQSNLHWTDFFDTVDEARMEVEGKMVEEILEKLGEGDGN